MSRYSYATARYDRQQDLPTYSGLPAALEMATIGKYIVVSRLFRAQEHEQEAW